MKLLGKIFLVGLALFLFGCFRKKNAAPSLAGWLEQHFPGRFQIVNTYTSDPIRHLSFQVKRSVVAERSQPLVQAVFHWDKRQPDVWMSVSAVDSAFAKAAAELPDAQAFQSALKTAGFERVSVGIHRGTAQVLIFEEPTPEHRRHSLKLVKNALAHWSAGAGYDLHLTYVEPAEYGVHFQEIVPLDYWETPGSLQLGRIIFWQSCRQPYQFDPAKMERDWQFNTDSKRFEQHIEQARNLTKEWAAEHLKQPYTLLATAEFGQDERHTTQVEFKFPYTTEPLKEGSEGASEEHISGYLVTRYDVDNRTFSPVKNSKG